MPTWKEALQRGAVSGSAASVLSTAALALGGRRQRGDAFEPTNATSHWVWGERAIGRGGASARHTLVGYAIHHGASIFWATLYEKWFGGEQPRSLTRTAGAAAGVAALAYVVDFRMTPGRLTPGFERRLTRGPLVAAYAAFGLGLAAATLLRKPRTPAAEVCGEKAPPEGPRVDPQDPVEEASYESFPASDPPSFSPSTVTGRGRNGHEDIH